MAKKKEKRKSKADQTERRVTRCDSQRKPQAFAVATAGESQLEIDLARNSCPAAFERLRSSALDIAPPTHRLASYPAPACEAFLCALQPGKLTIANCECRNLISVMSKHCSPRKPAKIVAALSPATARSDVDGGQKVGHFGGQLRAIKTVAGRGVRGTDVKRKVVFFFSASLAAAGNAGWLGGGVIAWAAWPSRREQGVAWRDGRGRTCRSV